MGKGNPNSTNILIDDLFRAGSTITIDKRRMINLHLCKERP